MDNTLFSQIYILKQLYPEKQRWAEKSVSSLKSIIEKYSNSIELDHIGFPENWEELLVYGADLPHKRRLISGNLI